MLKEEKKIYSEEFKQKVKAAYPEEQLHKALDNGDNPTVMRFLAEKSDYNAARTPEERERAMVGIELYAELWKEIEPQMLSKL